MRTKRSFPLSCKSITLGTSLLIGLCAVVHAGILTGSANGVLGEPDYTHTSSYGGTQNGMYHPYSVAIDTTNNRLFVSEYDNNRILWWNNASSLTDGVGNGTPADGVLGQANFIANTSNRGNGTTPSQSSFYNPRGIATDATGKLWVADYFNNRVLCFDLSVSTFNACYVLGQANYSSAVVARTQTALTGPYGVTVDHAGNIWVADAINNRVLRYNGSIIASSMPADIVLGTSTFTGLAGSGDMTANALIRPSSVKVDAAGNVYVAEYTNNRVVQFTAPISSGMASSVVLGQSGYGLKTLATTQSGMVTPYDISLDGSGNVWVAMYQVSGTFGSRIVRYSLPLASGMNADFVIGQSGFTNAGYNRTAGSAGAAVANGLARPNGMAFDQSGRMWIADNNNNRVLRYDLSTSTHTAGLVLGQNDFTHKQENQIDGKTLYNPYSVAVDTTTNRVFAADLGGCRVLWWNNQDSFTNGAAADGVLGQNSFTDYSANRGLTVSSDTLNASARVMIDPAGDIWVADSSNNRVLRYHGASLTSGMPADLVLGQLNFVSNSAGTATSTSLSGPSSVRCDREGTIWVVDSGYHRVLKYKKYSDMANTEPAVHVLGQSVMTAGLKNRDNSLTANQNSFYQPTDIGFDINNAPWIVDGNNNRVLLFSSGTITDGMNAAYVVGQTDFIGHAASTATLQGLNLPYGITFDRDERAWISDGGNARIMCYGPVTANAPSAAVTLGQSGLDQYSLKNPRGILSDPQGSLWVADGDNNRLLKFNGLSIAGVSPTQGSVSSGAMTAVLTGTDFSPSVQVRLERAGQTAIVSSSVTVTGETGLSATFSLTGATTGYWDVVTSTRGFSARSSNAILLVSSAAAQSDLNNVVENILTFTVGTVQITLDIPGGTFNDAFTIACIAGTQSAGLNQSGFFATPIALEITNSKGLQPLSAMTITVAYADADVAGMDESKLTICYYDTARARWIQVPSIPDPLNNKITGTINHLSSFRVFARVPLLTLADAVAYPNPYKPGSGTSYDDSVMGKGIVFGNITENARIRIFTISGELVKDISVTGSNGTCVWDATNDNGDKVASGVFQYFITNPDNSSQKAKGKIAVIR